MILYMSGRLTQMSKPVVVVPGLVRKDALAYLGEHVTIKQWTEKTPMPRETLKEWLKEADALWSINTVKVDADLIADAPGPSIFIWLPFCCSAHSWPASRPSLLWETVKLPCFLHCCARLSC